MQMGMQMAGERRCLVDSRPAPTPGLGPSRSGPGPAFPARACWLPPPGPATPESPLPGSAWGEIPLHFLSTQTMLQLALGVVWLASGFAWEEVASSPNKYALTLQATGCRNWSPDDSWWRTLNDEAVFQDMFNYCNLVAQGTASAAHKSLCCGETPCVPVKSGVAMQCILQTGFTTSAKANLTNACGQGSFGWGDCKSCTPTGARQPWFRCTSCHEGFALFPTNK